MTLSEFDREVANAFKKETFRLKRLDGLLDCKSLWDNWLSYEQYGTTRINSAQATKQGGRAQEPMCLHFFMGTSEYPGQVLMKYKYRETDPYFMPYDFEGIPVFSDDAAALPDILISPGIAEPKSWPDKEAIQRHLVSHKDMTSAQQQEWQDFFRDIPESAEDIPDTKRFKWLLPKLAQRFQEVRNGPSAGPSVKESDRPEKPDERVIWTHYTRADFNRDQKQREANYAREQHALRERDRSEKLAAEAESSSGESDSSSESRTEPRKTIPPRKRKRARRGSSSSESSDPEESDDSSLGSTSSRQHPPSPSRGASSDSDDMANPENTPARTTNGKKRGSKGSKKRTAGKLSLGENGVVEVEDVVLFNPDAISQAADRANGYRLGLCMGKVLEINSRKRMVLVWWLFGTEWSHKSPWKLWREPGSNSRYTDWIEADSLLVTSFGTLAKIVLVPKKRETFSIARESVETIQDVIHTND